MIVFIVFLAVFGTGVKDKAVRGVTDDVGEYNCDGELCLGCVIGGETCNCGKESCTCGENHVDRSECLLS